MRVFQRERFFDLYSSLLKNLIGIRTRGNQLILEFKNAFNKGKKLVDMGLRGICWHTVSISLSRKQMAHSKWVI